MSKCRERRRIASYLMLSRSMAFAKLEAARQSEVVGLEDGMADALRTRSTTWCGAAISLSQVATTAVAEIMHNISL